ncbi:hypothetical protein PR202_ga11383 [Eleusine coracana subsp. coracana]|uniref:Uncharacterized protein n=1 Tax=Eleusine coracana subsp. coracana TaxID=191504 RepID=A0AAV5C9C2_ELECO|nr:hypothetical protein PR202_ga11383 [Eleusine coracana subsp. coracana]
MSGLGCLPAGDAAALSRACRDGARAARLKTGSLLAILVASAVGICLPVALTRAFRGREGYARGLLLVKCYAAGVILSTSLVHVLPDAHAALADCAVATRRPWRDFPFAGLFTLVGALLALLVDLSASSHLEAHGHVGGGGEDQPNYEPIPKKSAPVFELAGEMSPRKRAYLDDQEDPEPRSAANGGDPDRDDVALFGARKGGPAVVRSDEVAVIGGGCHGGGHEVVEVGRGEEEEARKEAEDGVQGAGDWDCVPLGHHRGHHGDVAGCLRHPPACCCTVVSPGVRGDGPRRLHRAVELDLLCSLCVPEPLSDFRMILGGRILVAGFGMATVGYMCIMFSVTTPLGILLGMAVFHMTGYDDSSPNALIMEGILGSLSAGILIYMALVDLISLDFFHNKMMSSSLKLKKASYIALVLGSASMSILALWA